MIDFLGILTRTWLGVSSPAPQHQTVPPPLHTGTAAGSAAGSAAAVTPAPAAPATAMNANAVVTEVQKFYAGIKQVTSQFRQSVTNNTFGSTKTSDGTVWLSKPG